MLVCSWTSKSFSPDTLGVNFEVLNLHLYMDYCKFALGDKAKGFSWLPEDKFLNFNLFFQKLDLSVFVNLRGSDWTKWLKLSNFSFLFKKRLQVAMGALRPKFLGGYIAALESPQNGGQRGGGQRGGVRFFFVFNRKRKRKWKKHFVHFVGNLSRIPKLFFSF